MSAPRFGEQLSLEDEMAKVPTPIPDAPWSERPAMVLGVVVDIETVPTEAALQAPYPEAERPHPANYKNDDAIQRWRDADRVSWAAARAKECALSPRLGRIVVIGMDDLDVVARTEAEEAPALAKFWEFMEQRFGQVITFNGRFDLRFIVLRSLALRVKPSLTPSQVAGWFRKYVVHGHYDCRAMLTNWDDREPGTLTDWAAFLGIPVPADPFTGADVYDAYCAGDFDRIVAHCQEDRRMTQAIYEDLRPYFGY